MKKESLEEKTKKIIKSKKILIGIFSIAGILGYANEEHMNSSVRGDETLVEKN